MTQFSFPSWATRRSEATTLDRGRGEIAHLSPEVLPGGKAVLYLALVAPSKRQDLVVRSKETGETKVLLEGATGPARFNWFEELKRLDPNR